MALLQAWIFGAIAFAAAEFQLGRDVPELGLQTPRQQILQRT
jgi:hypothetical protein